jgi:hypothetical protein
MDLTLLWASVAGYIVLQPLALYLAVGREKWLAGAPLVIMVPIFVWTAAGLVTQSNLWPLPLLLASPLAFIYVVLALGEHWRKSRSTG